MEVERLSNRLNLILILKGFSRVGLREEERTAIVDVIMRRLALLFGVALNGDDSVCYFFVDLGGVFGCELVVA